MAVLNIRDVPEDLQVRVKVQAALERIPIKQLVVKALEEYLKKAERKGGGRNGSFGRVPKVS